MKKHRSYIPVYFTIFFALLSSIAYGQISGKVTDSEGQALPFVNIYIEGTTIGTSTNSEGVYELQYTDTSSRLVFQYIGYKSAYISIGDITERQPINVVLIEEAYNLKEITIAADAEDPAYEIIRKAQAKRRYYKDKVKEFSCSAYIKGNQKILDAPKKIMGFEIGDMDGMLDTNRQGIVYLSESVSKLYRKEKESKEIMISSKVSGDDQGYSFNSAREMDINFYESTIELNRQLVSPIAPNAMTFYNYKFRGSYFTEEGFEINKIEVIPKQRFLPTLSGFIYIKEDTWNIYTVDLTATSDNLDIPFIDSFNVVQVYVPGPETDQWLKLSDVFTFRLSGFGFDFRGTFSANYTDYDLSPIPSSFFNHEVYFVEDEANKRSEAYWDSLRPIPLVAEEVHDYVKKDSLQKVKASPEYLDSVDRAYNTFSVGDLISGFDRQNSKKKTRFSISSPLSHLSYNTVQGMRLGMSMRWTKRNRISRPGATYVHAYADYGLTEKKLRPTIEIGKWENSLSRFAWNIQGGRKVKQFNAKNTISDIQNLYETLFERQNILKLYQEDFGQLHVSSYLNHWIRASISAKYATRSPLQNTSEFSFFNRDKSFSINSPLYAFGQDLQFEPSNILLLETKWRFYPFQKTHRHPEYISHVRNQKYPIITLEFKRAFASTSISTEVDFTYAELSLQDDIPLGPYGNLSYYLAHGRFFGSFNGTYIDNAHFLSNESFDIQSKGRARFLVLPYFYATNSPFGQINLEHDFQGFIFDRIPLVRNFGWHLVISSRQIIRSDITNYHEYGLGIDNIGFGNFKLFQIHGIWSNNDEFNIVFGIKADL